MHISILHYAAPPVVGGVESTIYHHARLLYQSGYAVSIIAGKGAKFHDAINFIHIPEIDSRNPMVLRVGKQLANGEITQDFTNLKDELYESLSKALAGTDALIVHNAITLHKNLSLTAALKKITAEPNHRILAWCHDFAWQDTLYTPDLHPGYPWDLMKSIWNGVDYVAVSEHRKGRLAELLGLPPENIKVIEPGVDPYQFYDLSPIGRRFVDQNHIFESEPVILLPARITRRKNIEFAIQITSHLKQNFPRVALIITGPPGPHNPKNIEYLKSLLSLRSSLDLKSNIHFIYEMQGDDQIFNAPDDFIAELFRISDCVLFPSFREGFGIPVLEAGLAKVPIFASDIPPIKESSAGMINLFDPYGDPAQVAGMIVEDLTCNPMYQLRRHVLSNFTWQSIVKNKIIPLLESSGTSNDERE